MCGYDIRCPYCGKINKHVDLIETRGSMECEQCGMVSTIDIDVMFQEIMDIISRGDDAVVKFKNNRPAVLRSGLRLIKHL